MKSNAGIMKNICITISIGCVFFFSCREKQATSEQIFESMKDDLPGATVKEVNFQDVIINDDFWSTKIKVNRISSIRHALKQAEQSIGYFDIVAGKKEGDHTSNRASDSDVYKIIQGAAYALNHTPDIELEAKIDSIIDKVAAAQADDGYINQIIMCLAATV